MKLNKNYSKILSQRAGLLFTALLASVSLAGQVVTQTFTHTGAAQSFVLPPCVGGVTIIARGASGGTGGSSGPVGANGGIVQAVMSGTQGVTLNIFVGGQGSVTAGGYNGGGNGGTSPTSTGAGGGGASDVRIGGVALTDRIVVAAGGGGGGGSSSFVPTSGIGGSGSTFSTATGFGGGGGGGCLVGGNGGEAGGVASGYGSGGGGGGFTNGGSGGGQPSAGSGGYGCNGSLGNGGDGGGTSFICGGITGGLNGGGGGGGGYYGGGGGMTGTGGCNGGGGGGSSWVNSSLLTSPAFTAGANSGHGSIVILYDFITNNVTASGTATQLCIGSTATLTGIYGVSYSWTPVGNFAGSNNTVIAVSPTTTTQYTLTGTNSLNCIATSTVNVIVSQGLPVLTLSANTTNTCLGTSVLLTANGALNYSWTGGVTNGVYFIPTSTQVYTVTGSNGCGSVTATQGVTLTPLAVNITGPTSTICAGYPTTLIANAAANGYTWQPQTLTNSLVVVSPTASTVFSVFVSDGTCSGTASISLNTVQVPTVSASATNSLICEGITVTLTATGGQSYTWSPGGQNTSQIVVTPSVPTQYSVVGNNSFSCNAVAIQPVVVYPLPVLNLSSSSGLVCKGDIVILSVNGANVYSWAQGGTGSTVQVMPQQNTVYSVVGTTTANNCSSTASISVSIFIPTVTVSGNTAICIGGTSTLVGSGANNYSWNTGDNTPGIIISPTVSTGYTLAAISQSNSIMCPSTVTVQVVVNPNPTIVAQSTRSLVCKNETSQLSATGASSYTWTNGLSTSVSPSVTASSSLVTVLLYTVSGTNSLGCVGSATVLVKVDGCSNIDEVVAVQSLLAIYPNPAKNNFIVKSDTDIDLVLVNAIGQIIRYIKLNEVNNYTVSVSDLGDGLYYLVGQSNSRKIHQKIIISD